MSMTEPATPETPKPKRKASRRKAAAPRAPRPSNEYAGMTVTACASGCNASGCVVSGQPYCAHPAKGGLQGKDAGNPALLARIAAAKKVVGKQKIDPDKL